MRTRVFRGMILTVGLGGGVAVAWAAQTPSSRTTPAPAEECLSAASDSASVPLTSLPPLRSVP
ncbi:hypothetical protein ACYOEI_15245, partial [Singulisphaera rosea]